MANDEILHIMMSPALFFAIKYNFNVKPSDDIKNENELEEFEKFKKLYNQFVNQLNNADKAAFSTLSAIMSMFGYTRKYCGMCGKPIIGTPKTVAGRLVCNNCYESYRITDQLYKKNDIDYLDKKPKLRKHKKSEKNSERLEEVVAKTT